MQALALARRMAGRKKGEATQLQIEVYTEEEWEKLLEKEGLVVVDVYSGWCGPCIGMLGNLKKLKLEVGGDLLHLAIAKADSIDALARFRNKSEPTWMFIGSGHLVNLMFGANAPRLSRLIMEELEKETNVLKGEREREVIPFHQLTPEEEQRKEDEERRRQEQLAAEEEATAAKLNALRLLSLARRDVEPLHLVLLPPHVVAAGSDTGAWLEISQALTAASALVLEEHQVELQPESACAALELGAEGSEARREWCIALQTGPCVALLVGMDRQPEDEEEPDSTALAQTLHELLGPTDPVVAVETAPDSLSARYRDGAHVPGVWAPSEPERRTSAVALLFPELAAPENDGGDAPVEVAVGVFAAERQQAVLEALQSASDRMLAVSLKSIDEADAIQLAKENEALIKELSGERLVVALRTDAEHDAQVLSTLEPIYLSADPAIGVRDFQLLFPPSDEEPSNTEPPDPAAPSAEN